MTADEERHEGEQPEGHGPPAESAEAQEDGTQRSDNDRDDGDERSELAKEIEDDPAANPEEEMLRDIKGG